MFWLSWQHFPNRRDNETHVLSGSEMRAAANLASVLPRLPSVLLGDYGPRARFVMARIGCVLCRDFGVLRRHPRA
jgi:hypothetical protein